MDSDLETSNQPEAKKQTQLKRSDALCRQSSRTLKIKGTLFAASYFVSLQRRTNGQFITFGIFEIRLTI